MSRGGDEGNEEHGTLDGGVAQERSERLVCAPPWRRLQRASPLQLYREGPRPRMVYKGGCVFLCDFGEERPLVL